MRWALVTGGNRGLGLAVCRRLVSRGKGVILTARDGTAGAAAAEELRRAARHRAQVEVLRCDVSSEASLAQLARDVAARYGRQVDLLVANAGVYRTQWRAPDLAECVDVNCDGAAGAALALAPHLAEGALVIVVSSSLGQLAKLTPDYAEPISAAATLEEVRRAALRYDPASPLPQHNLRSPDYSVSKAAVNRAVQLLAAPGSPLTSCGISIAAVCPGWCRTAMGTDTADRSPEQGAASILWPWEQQGGAAAVHGTFTRDGGALAW